MICGPAHTFNQAVRGGHAAVERAITSHPGTILTHQINLRQALVSSESRQQSWPGRLAERRPLMKHRLFFRLWSFILDHFGHFSEIVSLFSLRLLFSATNDTPT